MKTINNKENNQSLFSAIKKGDVQAVALWLEVNSDAHPRNKDGEPPIHFAIQQAGFLSPSFKNITQIIKLFIDYGADLNSKDNNGRLALHHAASFGSVTLLELCATLNKRVIVDLNAKDNDDKTPLHYAVTSESIGNLDTETASALLSNGADVNAKDNEGKTPLHYVIINKSSIAEDLIKLFVSHGADVNAKDNQGKSPLDIAKESQDTDIVDLLLPPSHIIIDIDLLQKALETDISTQRNF